MATNTALEKVAEAEQSFRNSLEDVIAIADGLSRHCKTVEDLIAVSKLAMENDAQLRIVMDLVTQPNKK